MQPELHILAPIVFAAYTAQAICGFGGTVLTLTIGGQFYPITSILPLLVPASLTQTGYLMIRHRGRVEKELLLEKVLPSMVVGVAIGLAIFQLVSGRLLERAYGVLVVLLASRELWLSLRVDRGDATPPSGLFSRAIFFFAGIVHGIYSSSGPLVVYALGRLPLDKSTFRATLMVIWVFFGVILTSTYAATGKLTPDMLPKIAALIPALALSLLIGEWAHARIGGKTFRIAVFTLLLLSGLALAKG